MASDSTQELGAIIDSTVTLLASLRDSLPPFASPAGSATAPPADPAKPSLPALALARDSAALVKSHATKLSLLIINTPFTPSVVGTVLRDVASGPAPALATAAGACDARRYTSLARRELSRRCSAVLGELQVLVEKVPRDGRVVAESKRTGGGAGTGGVGSVTATGVLWAACDEVTAISREGAAGLLARMVAGWGGMLKDTIEELDDYKNDGADEDSDDEEEDGEEPDDDEAEMRTKPDRDGGDKPTAQDMIDEIMASPRPIPKSDPDGLRPRLENALRRLRLAHLLYQAALKRRLKPLAAGRSAEELPEGVAERIDRAMERLARIPDLSDDLAHAFYELDAQRVDALLQKCCDEAVEAAVTLSDMREGAQPDHFADWVAKFKAGMGRE